MKNVTHNISYFHDSEDSNCGFLIYESIESSTLVPTFGRNTLLTSAGLKQFNYGHSIFHQNITTQLLHHMLSQFKHHTLEIFTVMET
jgi:hypothetical protein